MSETALARVLGSLLMTHYRSRYPGQNLQMVLDLPLGGGVGAPRVDIGIVSLTEKRVVAAYELVRPGKHVTDALTRIARIKEYLALHSIDSDPGPAIGLVMPDSAATPEMLQHMQGHIEVMTYAA